MSNAVKRISAFKVPDKLFVLALFWFADGEGVLRHIKSQFAMTTCLTKTGLRGWHGSICEFEQKILELERDRRGRSTSCCMKSPVGLSSHYFGGDCMFKCNGNSGTVSRTGQKGIILTKHTVRQMMLMMMIMAWIMRDVMAFEEN